MPAAPIRRCLTCGEPNTEPRATHYAPECRVPKRTRVALTLELTERQLRAIAMNVWGQDRPATEAQVREWATEHLVDHLKEALSDLEYQQADRARRPR